MKKLTFQLAKILASTEEINIGMNALLKQTINRSKTSLSVVGEENLAGIRPINGEAFYANVCEPEGWRGRFQICQNPVYSTILDAKDKNYWRIFYCRQICDKIHRSGICRRALVKIAYQ